MGTNEEQAPAENAESNEWGTDLGIRTDAQADDVSTRSARSSVMTTNEADTSLGSMPNVPVNGNELRDERGDTNVRIGEGSHAGDERVVGARVRAIDLWD